MPQSTCSIDGCTGKHLARGWCSKHYSRWNRHGDPLWEPEPIPAFRPCSVDGCTDALKAKGLCSDHLERLRRNGSPTALSPREQKLADILASGEQECIKCFRTLPLTDFYPDKSRARGVKHSCRRCDIQTVGEWAARNKPRVEAGRRKRQALLTQEDRARRNEVTSRWKRENAARVRDANHRRKALLRNNAVGEIDYEALWEQCGGTCTMCGHDLSRDTPWPEPRFASVDHIVPLSLGGPHSQENLRYTCLVCNLKKHTALEGPAA